MQCCQSTLFGAGKVSPLKVRTNKSAGSVYCSSKEKKNGVYQSRELHRSFERGLVVSVEKLCTGNLSRKLKSGYGARNRSRNRVWN
jgi:hypothetical protein